MGTDASRSRLFLACLGAASLSGLAVAGLEVLVAAWASNGLLGALPAAQRLRYLALVLAQFPVVALPAAVIGFAAASIRPQLGITLSLAIPPLFLAEESFRHGAQPAGIAPLVLGGMACVFALGLVHVSLRRTVSIPARFSLPALVAATLALLVLPRLSLEPSDRGPVPAGLRDPVALPSRQGPRVENVLILLVDTLRADHLGCYGYARDTSPRIDAFAEQGTLFESAATPKPKTSPAVASLFTGTGPQTHRVHAARTELLQENVTLAETLKLAGFATFGVSANTNINKTLGYGQGFDELRWLTRVELSDGEVVDNHASQLAGHVIPWLEEHRDERFLAYVHFIDPHSPYRPPAPFDEMFRGDDLDGRLGSTGQEGPGTGYIDRIQKSVFLPEEGSDLDGYVARYDGEIRFTDEAIGAILDALDRTGLAQSTLVVFLSDHGESITEHHAYFNHGLFPYEEQVHVPLVLRGPGIAPGQRRREQVSLVALMPTLLDLLEVPVPAEVEAESFAGLLVADAPEQQGSPSLISAREDAASMTWCLRTNRWKYLFNPGRQSLHSALQLRNLVVPARRLAHTVGEIRNYQLREELYDLQADPEESRNLAYRRPGVRDRMGERMEALRAAARPVDGVPKFLSTKEFSEEARKDLIRLGYMGD